MFRPLGGHLQVENLLERETLPEYPNWKPAETQKQQQRGEHTQYNNPPTGDNPAIRTSHMHLGHSYEIFIVLRTDSTKNCVPSVLIHL